MFHRSKRLFLRPAFPEDWSAILSAIGDKCVVRNLARAPWPYRESDARAFAAVKQDCRLPHFLVTIPTKGVIGSVGLGLHGDEVELGYWIARAFWGQGYATEAGRAMIAIARMIGHRRLIAAHFIDNPASGKVLRKLGFRPSGRVQSHFCHARRSQIDAVEFALDLNDPTAMPALVA